jgi:hypothetical protein
MIITNEKWVFFRERKKNKICVKMALIIAKIKTQNLIWFDQNEAGMRWLQRRPNHNFSRRNIHLWMRLKIKYLYINILHLHPTMLVDRWSILSCFLVYTQISSSSSFSANEFLFHERFQNYSLYPFNVFARSFFWKKNYFSLI